MRLLKAHVNGRIYDMDEREYERQLEKEVDVEDSSSDSSEFITTPFKPSDIRLTTPPMNLGDLIDMIREGWVNFGTEYQREGNLWDDKKQSRLIESVLLGLRLPAFYFEEVSKRQWNIIDGLQRCCAIKNFCVDETLDLGGLEFLSEKFSGAKYSSLSYEIIRDIRMLPITVNVLDKGTPPEVKYILFKRLNTGGVNLTLQEVRTAMFQGKVVEILKDMAGDKSFLEATCHRIPTRRQEDRDFVSRFIAFYLFDYHDFQPDLDSFIFRSMEYLRDKCSFETTSRMKQDFHSAMQAAVDIFGNDAFRKRTNTDEARRPINKAYFEVIATTFAKMDKYELETLIAQKELLKQNLLVLMNNKSFSTSLSGGTGTRDSVLRRFGWFGEAVSITMNERKVRINDDNKIEAV